VQQPAEPISTPDPTGGDRRSQLDWIWRPEGQRPVRALAVVVLDEGARDPLELARADDEQPVETLRAYGPNEALGMGVCPWSLQRGEITLIASLQV
jgi:hypothetical protein